MSMADNIKQMRIKKGLTQEELGEKLGLQKSAIAKYENGKVNNIKRSTIAKMADIFDVDPVWLMDLSDNKSSEEQFIMEQIRLLSPTNRAKLIELIHLFLTAQDKS